MWLGLSNMEATGHSDMHRILIRVDFRGAPLQRVTRMRREPVGIQRKTLGLGLCPSFSRGEITHTACVHEGHSDLAAATAELGAEEERHKNVSGSEIYCCNLQSSEFSSCSNGGALLVHVQWL